MNIVLGLNNYPKKIYVSSGFELLNPSNKRVVEKLCDNANLDRLDIAFQKIQNYLTKFNFNVSCTDELSSIILSLDDLQSEINKSRLNGEYIKKKNFNSSHSGILDHLKLIPSYSERSLKNHQQAAYLHLSSVGRSANFSVPGSGKTSVVLCAYSYFQSIGEADALIVIGPLNCFGSWSDEFKKVFKKHPNECRLSGGDVRLRQSMYMSKELKDIYLCSIQTAANDLDQLKKLMTLNNRKFFMVIDEAHYIKNPDGFWGKSLIELSKYANKKCILTGTPFPRSFNDGFNYFDLLWGKDCLISSQEKNEIDRLSTNQPSNAKNKLRSLIDPFFYRVKKSDLNLTDPVFHPAIKIDMNPIERSLYDAVLEKIRDRSSDYGSQIDDAAVWKLQRGRLMRLRQCISYASMLGKAFEDEIWDNYKSFYSTNKVAETDDEIILSGLEDTIKDYDYLEIPAKISALKALIDDILRKNGKKILIWTNFIMTMQLIKDELAKKGLSCLTISGSTRTGDSNDDEKIELSREQTKNLFLDNDSGFDVLIANPAACAESMSLHTSCHHAIYYDLSYNGAQYMQSLDRIHRVGGSENIVANYYFLEYENTIDSDIRINLEEKKERQTAIIEDDSIFIEDIQNDDVKLINSIMNKK